MAQNIHHEADGEPFMGKLAVGLVTLNRKNLKNRSICQIVFEPNQFSWTNKESYAKNFSQDTWLATNLIMNNLVKIPYLENIVYFHNKNIKATWSNSKNKVAVIGDHIFYTEK
jgi:spore germination cell wall hydrolase CwlJ-like protein